MSDADGDDGAASPGDADEAATDDELEAIRARKREELARRAEDGTATGDAAATDDAPAATPAEPVHVEGADHFQGLVAREGVVLVDFYADWCGPCKMLEPVVADVAAETDALVAKVDIDAHRELAGQHRVQGVPTLLLFAGGEPRERLVGVQQKPALVELVERYA